MIRTEWSLWNVSSQLDRLTWTDTEPACWSTCNSSFFWRSFWCSLCFGTVHVFDRRGAGWILSGLVISRICPVWQNSCLDKLINPSRLLQTEFMARQDVNIWIEMRQQDIHKRSRDPWRNVNGPPLLLQIEKVSFPISSETCFLESWYVQQKH